MVELSTFFKVANGLIDLVHVTLGIDIDSQDSYLQEINSEILPAASKTRAKRVATTKAKKVIIEESDEEEEEEEEEDQESDGNESEDNFAEE